MISLLLKWKRYIPFDFTQFDDGLSILRLIQGKIFSCADIQFIFIKLMEVYPDNLKDYKEHEIAYHHGAENKPIVVHISNMIPQVSEKLTM